VLWNFVYLYFERHVTLLFVDSQAMTIDLHPLRDVQSAWALCSPLDETIHLRLVNHINQEDAFSEKHTSSPSKNRSWNFWDNCSATVLFPLPEGPVRIHMCLWTVRGRVEVWSVLDVALLAGLARRICEGWTGGIDMMYLLWGLLFMLCMVIIYSRKNKNYVMPRYILFDSLLHYISPYFVSSPVILAIDA